MSEERNAARTGRSTASQIKRATRRPRDQVTLPRDADNDDNEFRAMAEQFPTDAYDVEDPMDERMETILKMQQDALEMDDGAQPGQTVAGVVPWDERVVSYMQRKKDKQLEYAFEKWFANWFDRQNEAQKAYARKMYPNFYRRRLATLKENAKLAEDLARIKITGVQNRRDLFLKYAADQGFINTDSIAGALLSPPGATDGTSTDEFVRGVFNVRGWGTGRTGARTANPDGTWQSDNERINLARGINARGFYGDVMPGTHEIRPNNNFHGRRRARTTVAYDAMNAGAGDVE